MSYTLLNLISRVAGQIGLTQPSAVIGSQDPQIIQLQYLAEQLGQDLLKEYEWQRLVKPHYFTTTAARSGTCNVSSANTALTGFSSVSGITAGMVVSGTGIPSFAEVSSVDTAQSTVYLTYPALLSTSSVSMNFITQDYALPSDFWKEISDTNWDRTNHWRNLGPKTSQEWQWIQGGIISIGPRERYRIIGNKLRYFGAPVSPLNIAYEYVSNSWIIASGGTLPSLSAFASDSDTFIYRDDVMIHGLKYYWRESKGLDFTADYKRYQEALSSAKAQDQPVSAANLAPWQLPELVGPWSVQDGNWPQGSS